MANDGFEEGLRYWLVFLLGFFLLGYPVPLSIFLGGLAGLAGGLIAAYWKQLSLSKPPEAPPNQQTHLLGRVTQRFGQRFGQWRKQRQELRDSSRPKLPGSKSRRTLKSRR
jgi:hypothetical protein